MALAKKQYMEGTLDEVNSQEKQAHERGKDSQASHLVLGRQRRQVCWKDYLQE